MIYTLEQKFVSVGKDFLIKNEGGQVSYIIDGYGFSLGKRFSLQNPRKEEIFDVRQKLGAFSPTYRIKKNGKVIAKVRKSIGSFRDILTLTMTDSGTKIIVKGKMVEHEYKFTKDKKVIAEVSKKWFRGTDTYAIKIDDESFSLQVIATAVIIDLVCHEAKSKHDRG